MKSKRKSIADLMAESVSPEQVKQVSDTLDTREPVNLDDKRQGLNLLVTIVEAAGSKMNIA